VFVLQFKSNGWRSRSDEGAPAAVTNPEVASAIDNLLKTTLPSMFTAQLKPIQDALAALKPPTPPVVEPPPVTAPKIDTTKMDPELAAQFLAMTRQIESLTTTTKAEAEARKAADERAEKADKKTALTTALQALPMNDGESLSTAYRLIDGDIRKDESGAWVGPDGTPIGVYVDKLVTEKHPYFLKSKEVGGAGAPAAGRRTNNPGVQLEDIKKGMTAEQKAAVFARISEVARQGY
jgi:hypothetical protein